MKQKLKGNDCLSSVWKQKFFGKIRSDLSKNFNYFWKKPDLLWEKKPPFTSVWRHKINLPEKDFEPATFGVLAVMTASTFVWYKIPTVLLCNTWSLRVLIKVRKRKKNSNHCIEIFLPDKFNRRKTIRITVKSGLNSLWLFWLLKPNTKVWWELAARFFVCFLKLNPNGFCFGSNHDFLIWLLLTFQMVYILFSQINWKYLMSNTSFLFKYLAGVLVSINAGNL